MNKNKYRVDKVFISAISMIVIIIVSTIILAVNTVLVYLNKQIPLQNFLLGELIYGVVMVIGIHLLYKKRR